MPTDLDTILEAETIAIRLAAEATALATRLRNLRTNPDQVPTNNGDLVELGGAIDTPRLIANQLADPAFHFHGMSD